MTFALSRRGFLLSSGALMALAPQFARAQAGGRITIAADSEPRQLNPAIVASNGVFFVASKVIEPLAEASYDGEGLTPLLATGWEGSEDGLSITFTLREGVTWHDGQPFTSADVAFSALEVWKPLQNIGRSLFANLESVETPDDHTSVFIFSQPTPLQLITLALPTVSSVLPRHIYEGTDIAENPANRALIGTGPYTWGDYRPGEYFLLRRNPNYWQADLPVTEELVFRVLPDRAAAANSLEADEIQLAAFSAVPLVDLARIGQVPGLQVITKGYEALTYQLVVEINHRNEYLSNLSVRRAIAHAIDKQFVLDTIFLGYAAAATGPVPANDPTFYTPDVTTYDFDVAAANALLDEAGFAAGANGVRFALRLLPAPYFNETRQFGDYLRQALAAIGIEATIIANDSAGHQRAVYTDHAFDLAVAPPVFRADPAISTTNLVRSGLPAGVTFSNQGGYQNADLDALIDTALTTLDTATRVDLYHQFQQKVTEDLPLINVADWSFTSVASDRLQNIATNPRWAVSNWADFALAE
ncbi:ABC transporter substrate-binding protein [Ketogulonicigenium vulgare]|uniref:ABC transporter, substrate-binding protein (Oligopeptide) n=1 Tax=Ketogulonicigenium vulgare (strain WSH-001) TaxID=759362 RepID=F9Y600_KETVW|nr:ABC transporter substrate-binding protein [Ketogulonicigenium vulgare]ADO42633.1 ABC transporter, substrate binding protein (oligopeptide) [Ketogulonicigenium vulgare Y25]AEM40825.1 ABC transporter, substrate-binding protein (Oligopeptide) [Ketogulonicigenium vulgare WSH-001]ALJ80990.1 ABC transporter substrate-binding protein [Ketogulonicigenium vulgare]ANW33755.1 ABC transporter substrate-binding protein [Ketogulonicigenium vulgare]AOZ54543.1 peptide ABC transporter substrate-binding prot